MRPAPAQPVLLALNHLLASESWATERLRPFAGQTLAIESGSLVLRLVVNDEGLFALPSTGGESTVTIGLPVDTPWRLLTDRPSILANARLAGPADFTETLGFVLRNLHWDAEADLAALVGDIPARRLVMAGRRFIGWQAAAARNVLANIAEYGSEESGLLVPARELQSFAASIGELRGELADLERRLQKLSG